ncbi:hypothetical protein F5Y02DRAFT_406032 [Annulohypoxylon stygium]|nr:hypothetical protein F5Y02DRAFT_406032 [Annulohypoxylon stygium]
MAGTAFHDCQNGSGVPWMVFASADFFSLADRALVNRWVCLGCLADSYREDSVDFLFFTNLGFGGLFSFWLGNASLPWLLVSGTSTFALVVSHFAAPEALDFWLFL